MKTSTSHWAHPLAACCRRQQSDSRGVILEDELVIHAEKTILATGVWSSLSHEYDKGMRANEVGISYFKLIEEYEKYKDIACHTNLATGLNIFTPLRGRLKVLKRATGLYSTIELPDP
jgi:hypothetical protein